MSDNESVQVLSSDVSSDNESEPQPVLFFLASTINISNIINYIITEGRKYFERAVAKLNDEMYDVEKVNV